MKASKPAIITTGRNRFIDRSRTISASMPIDIDLFKVVSSNLHHLW